MGRQGRDFLKFLDYLPFYRQTRGILAKTIVMQDYELVRAQQERLKQGAKPWLTPIPVDRLPAMYRSWYKRAFKTNPWFRGYNVTDIEELDKMKESGCLKGSNCYYDEDVPPSQDEVDNTSYFMSYAARDSPNEPFSGRRLVLHAITISAAAILLSGLSINFARRMKL